MTVARQQQVCLQATPFYHCVTRCVRRAFLCGQDPETGRNFSHRKRWIADRLKKLASVFAIDLCAYTVMNNHYHLVIRIDQARALKWSDHEVIERWKNVFRGNELVDRYISGEMLSPDEDAAARDVIALWRSRLHDLSWFMRCINEPMARFANQEDNCKGRFWESRFKCQALLDEAALISCMAYVDLNPVRAGASKTPETSDFTSFRERARQYKACIKSQDKNSKRHATPQGLCPFNGCNDRTDLPITLPAYIELVDWTGRAIRKDKRGHIPQDILPILVRLNIAPDKWLQTVYHFSRRFHCVVGGLQRIRVYSDAIGRKWMKGLSSSRQFYRLAGA